MSRKSLVLLTALLAVPLLSLHAHADTIDNFTLVGNGHTVIWSLPDNAAFPDFSLFNFFSESAPATIDGISGYTITGSYYTIFYPGLSVEFFLPASVFGTSAFPLAGPQFTNISFVPATNPPPYFQEDVIGGFFPGTYQLHLLLSTPPDNFTLTINQQTTPAPTPEPSSLLLLATGALSLGALCPRRIRTGRLYAN